MTDKIDLELRVAIRYKRLHDSAKKRNKEFTLTLTDMKKLIKQQHCQYTGVELTDNDNNDLSLPTHRTFERIDPRVGYTRKNTIVVSRLANALKEKLLENAYTNPNSVASGNATECIGLDMLKKFVLGVEAAGYKDPDDVEF